MLVVLNQGCCSSSSIELHLNLPNFVCTSLDHNHEPLWLLERCVGQLQRLCLGSAYSGLHTQDQSMACLAMVLDLTIWTPPSLSYLKGCHCSLRR